MKLRIVNQEPVIKHCDYLEMFADIKDESVGLVVTDPPFGVNYKGGMNSPLTKHRIIKGDEKDFSYSDLATESYRVLEDDSAAFFYSHWSVFSDHWKHIERAGFNMREPLIAHKRKMGSTQKDRFYSCSDWIIFATKGKFEFRETRLIRNKWGGKVFTYPGKKNEKIREWMLTPPASWFGDQFPYSTEYYKTAQKLGLNHPTVKSQKFISWLILLCSDPGDMVCDPFVGSGTTPAACVQTGRGFIGSEIDDEYFKMAMKRVSKRGFGL